MAKIKAVEKTAWEKVMVAVKKSVEFVNKLIATRPKLAVALAVAVGVVISEPVKFVAKTLLKVLGALFLLTMVLGPVGNAVAQSANGVPGAAATPYYRNAMGAIGPDGKLGDVRRNADGSIYVTLDKPVVSPTPTWNATTTPTQPPTSTPTATNTPYPVNVAGGTAAVTGSLSLVADTWAVTMNHEHGGSSYIVLDGAYNYGSVCWNWDVTPSVPTSIQVYTGVQGVYQLQYTKDISTSRGSFPLVLTPMAYPHTSAHLAMVSGSYTPSPTPEKCTFKGVHLQ